MKATITKPLSKPDSITDLIAWLETKPPEGRYDFHDCEGACLMGQYFAQACGIEWGEADVFARTGEGTYQEIAKRGSNLDYVGRGAWTRGEGDTWTYGQALDRAKAIGRPKHLSRYVDEFAFRLNDGNVEL